MVDQGKTAPSLDSIATDAGKTLQDEALKALSQCSQAMLAQLCALLKSETALLTGPPQPTDYRAFRNKRTNTEFVLRGVTEVDGSDLVYPIDRTDKDGAAKDGASFADALAFVNRTIPGPPPEDVVATDNVEVDALITDVVALLVDLEATGVRAKSREVGGKDRRTHRKGPETSKESGNG